MPSKITHSHDDNGYSNIFNIKELGVSYVPYPPNQGVQPLRQYEFPLWALPPLLQDVIHDINVDIQAPLGLTVNAVMGAVSLACQGLVNVSPLEGKIWPTSLFLFALAESGERKSSVDRLVMQPFHEYDQAAAADYEKELKVYKSAYLVWSTQQSAILGAIKRKVKHNESTVEEEKRLGVHNNDEPQPPRKHKLLYSNTTSQALLADMAGVGSSVGLIADEGGNILDHGVIQDLSSLNLLWDGSSLSVERKTAGRFRVDEARLTFSLMVQHAIFERFLRRQGEVPRGSGFFARCLPVWIDASTSTQGHRFINNHPRQNAGLARFHARIRELLALQREGCSTTTLCFPHHTRVRWTEYYNHIESQIKPGGIYHDIGDFASKMSNIIARMTALFHYFSGNEGEVYGTTVDNAFTVCQWYALQALRMFSPEADCLQDARRAAQLLVWLQVKFREKNIGGMRKNDIRRSGPSAIRDKERLESALQCLLQSRHVLLGKDHNGALYVNIGQSFHYPLSV